MSKFQDSSGVACCLDWEKNSETFSNDTSNYYNSNKFNYCRDFKRNDSFYRDEVSIGDDLIKRYAKKYNKSKSSVNLHREQLPSKICLVRQPNISANNSSEDPSRTSDLYCSRVQKPSKSPQSFWSGKLTNTVHNTKRRPSTPRSTRKERDIVPAIKDRNYGSSRAPSNRNVSFGRSRFRRRSLTPIVKTPSRRNVLKSVSQRRGKRLSPVNSYTLIKERLKNRRNLRKDDYYQDSDEFSDTERELCDKLRSYVIDVCDEKGNNQMRNRSSSRQRRRRRRGQSQSRGGVQIDLESKIEKELRKSLNCDDADCKIDSRKIKRTYKNPSLNQMLGFYNEHLEKDMAKTNERRRTSSAAAGGDCNCKQLKLCDVFCHTCQRRLLRTIGNANE